MNHTVELHAANVLIQFIRNKQYVILGKVAKI